MSAGKSRKQSQQRALSMGDEPEPKNTPADPLVGCLENAPAHTCLVANKVFSHAIGAIQKSIASLTLSVNDSLLGLVPYSSENKFLLLMTDANEEEDKSSLGASDDVRSLSKESDDEDARKMRKKLVGLLENWSLFKMTAQSAYTISAKKGTSGKPQLLPAPCPPPSHA
ncbi:hypothetical protein EDC04DRAFT_2921918 [Pisolithus marmoratus]|nr:hypothetical protein EDC04DRAFT_2921918 [Pisolithus marmoratus]